MIALQSFISVRLTAYLGVEIEIEIGESQIQVRNSGLRGGLHRLHP